MRSLDGKYHIEGEMILNTKTREPIPLDEPLFLFRARDHHALGTIEDYEGRCKQDCGPEHMDGIDEQIRRFADFRRANPERMKEPGNSLRKRPPPELSRVETLLKKDWQTIEVILRRLTRFEEKLQEMEVLLGGLLLPKRKKRGNRGETKKRVSPKAARLSRRKRRD